jgi:hypothetical protein
VFSFPWYAVNEEGVVIRFGIVTYGKHDCGDFTDKKDIFGPCIRENQAVWYGLPEEEKSVGSHVFEGCDPKLGKFFQNPHTMKLVTPTSNVRFSQAQVENSLSVILIFVGIVGGRCLSRGKCATKIRYGSNVVPSVKETTRSK